MRHRKSDQRASYLVVLDGALAQDQVRQLAAYLSSVSVAGCEVIIVDDTVAFDRHHRVLRWVARHVAALPRHRALTGAIDPIRCATDLASCEKIIVAHARVRYDDAGLEAVCARLDAHEVVEPHDYSDPLPWWGSIDAGRILLHRGIEPLPDHGQTFAFRRNVIGGLRGIDAYDIPDDDPVRRLRTQGAEVCCATDLFIRNEPPMIGEWLHQRSRQAGDDFALPVKTAFFFALIPLLALVATFGGLRMAGGYAGMIAIGSIALAVRGRIGATMFYPWRACLLAPLWVLERSLTVYWALLRKLTGTDMPTHGVPVPHGTRGEKVASGE